MLTAYRWSAVTMMLVVITAGVGAWPASFAVKVETSALRLRGKTQGVGELFHNVASIVFNLTLPYMYNPDAGYLRGKMGFVYGGICLFTAVVTWLIVPEMKGRTVLDIDQMFSLGLKAREFKKWEGNADAAARAEMGKEREERREELRE
jgi:Sugar (and other) transporter